MTHDTHISNTESTPIRRDTAVAIRQLSMGHLLAVWAAATVPMGILSWIVAPRLATVLDGPAAFFRALVLTLTVGLAWQAVMVFWLVRREQGNLRWSVLRDALWLRSPVSPKTGRRGGRLWLILIPLMAFFYMEELIPGIAAPADRDLGPFLESAFGQTFFDGNWTWFALVVLQVILVSVLGEELLFRGYLLPRMNGAFGKWDWLANGVLFAFYHVHIAWAIPVALLDTLILSYPSKRYHSAWIGIAVHSAQSIFITVTVLLLVI